MGSGSVVQDGREAGVFRGRRECDAPREHLVEHHRGAPEVRALVHLPRVLDLLGAHVRRRPEERSRPSARPHSASDIHDLGDAEVQNLDDEGAGRIAHEKHVVGLEIAVHDPLGMGCGEARENAVHDGNGLRQRHTPPLRVYAPSGTPSMSSMTM